MHTITAVSLWHVDITRLLVSSFEILSQPLMQPIPIVTCFGEFLLLLSSSAGEIHVQSDLNLETDLTIWDFPFLCPYKFLDWTGRCFGSLSWCNMKHFPMNLVAFSWILVGKMILHPSKLILLLSWYIKSSVKLRGPVPAAAMHAHAMTTPPPCFTDEAVCLGSFTVPFYNWYDIFLAFNIWRMNATGHSWSLRKTREATVPILMFTSDRRMNSKSAECLSW